MSIMLETKVDIQIVRRTSYTHKRPKDTDPFANGGYVTGQADDIYNFANGTHRKDLFDTLVSEYDKAHGWHGDMEKLVEELKEAIEEYKEELPFR